MQVNRGFIKGTFGVILDAHAIRFLMQPWFFAASQWKFL
jgi:hypothetical protein